MALMTDAMKWCLIVTQSIRYAPDREEVYNELMAHIEDKIEALENKGYTKEEAAAFAVESMGDAKELGKELDRQHSYVLGRLYDLSKHMIKTMVVFFLCYQFIHYIDIYWVITPTVTNSEEEIEEEYSSYDRVWYTPLNMHETIGEYKLEFQSITAYESEGVYTLLIPISVRLPLLKEWEPMYTISRVRLYLDDVEIKNMHRYLPNSDSEKSDDIKIYASFTQNTSRLLKESYYLEISGIQTPYKKLVLSYDETGYKNQITIPISEVVGQ